ncbi:restriction endonuclease subunit S [Chroococcidiopsis thermalis]|uniref:Restriction modification system DNA specificity domain protein n=1 Tax=Chroococcidiopsis thermalis (strain PCC 7203) TaxID=251229 RepID=K9U3I9_CHRTP|nr:restriction endonuclease subunit S [Chroococcidiopsis thermalis]AFY89208.1 restriction modification system DNA specificity domain protein [Chroococcidiopsis thermalis PCC 7203]
MLNENTALPEGWCWSSIAQIAFVMSGQTPKGIDNASVEDGEIPWFRVGNMNKAGNEETLQLSDVRLTLEKAHTLGLHIYPKGTVVFPKRGGAIATNKKRILGQPSAYDLNLMGVLPVGLNSRYFWHWFQSINLKELSDGSNVPQINHGDIEPLRIPVPPLNEQRRIVAKIETLKARSQQAKEALEAIPPLLDQFRQSVLAAAFRGNLTADWREKTPDVEPASVLLERIKDEVPEPKNKKADSELPDPFQIPDEWKWVSLSSICRSITDGDHQPPPKAAQGVPFLVISNINNGELDFSNIRYVPEEYYQSIQRHRKAEKGDLLYSVVGSYGIPVLVDTEDKFCFQRHIALLKPCYLISSKYLLYALKSDFVFRQATEVATGTTQLTVTLSGLRRIKVPLVSLTEQKEIVKRIETLLKIAQRVEGGYQGIKANIDQLDRSILAKAFRGELVPQDPNDEPASVLLERIRAERAKQETAAKTAKKSTTKTSGKRRRKTQQQDSESVQLGLPGLE